MRHLELVPPAPPIAKRAHHQVSPGYYICAQDNLVRISRVVQHGMQWFCDGAIWCPDNKVWHMTTWNLNGEHLEENAFNLKARVEFRQ